jgi:DNA invertase Pin-like site-specific DNA recombinase
LLQNFFKGGDANFFLAQPRINKRSENMTVFEKNNAINNAFSKIELVAAYIRVSHQEQKLHGLSLDAQRMKLKEYAEKNNMRIVEWYVDEGVSGRKLIKNRPELQRMIQDAEKGKFQRIIFIKLDRFFRSVAEYHECMKRIAPVIWSTTEEEYDLTTANGRMLVNMKLTIAELEADQTGERIKIVNDYKVQTGQPLVGDQSLPFGFKNAVDPNTGIKKIIKHPEYAEILEDAIQHFFTHQSKRKTLMYLHAKHHINMSYQTLSKLLVNPMLCGQYRDNPSYCEAYMDRETFDKLQTIIKRNVKANTANNRTYLFTGLIKCPECGCMLKGTYSHKRRGETVYTYNRYRCAGNRLNHNCTFIKSISENVIERMLLDNIEKYLEDAKVRSAKIEDANAVAVPQIDIDAILTQIDRLNYSWQTGKIRSVEQYEKDYAALTEQLEKAEAERKVVPVKDFSKMEGILYDGWRTVYDSLDPAYKRAWWRSFIQSIEITWTTKTKKINTVNFF